LSDLDPRVLLPKKPEPKIPTEQAPDTLICEPLSKKDGNRKSKKSAKSGGAESSKPIAPTSLPADELNVQGQVEQLEVDPNDGRRKRRKTASLDGKTASADTVTQLDAVKPKEGTRSRQRKSLGTNGTPMLAGINGQLALKAAPQPPDKLLHQGDDSKEVHSLGGNPIENSKVDIMTVLDNGNRIPIVEPCLASTSDGGKDGSVQDGSSNSSTPLTSVVDNKPKKILRFNPKTGTIGSPPAKKIVPPAEANGKISAKGREPPRSRIVIICYGQSELLPKSIGPKINDILNNTKQVIPPPLDMAPRKPEAEKPSSPKPPKTIHPLFLGKAAMKNPIPQTVPRQDTSVIDLTQPKESTTLGQAKRESFAGQLSPKRPAATAFSGFGSSANILKFPGAIEPAWPWQGMIHVRGSDSDSNVLQNPLDDTPNLRSRDKKSKYHAVEVLTAESVIDTLAVDLCISEVVKDIRDINPDEFPALPPCLRIPIKHYESGLTIQRRIRKQLHTRLLSPTPVEASSSEDEIQTKDSTRLRVHPALSKVYSSIATSLSAFDRGQCETQPWIQKYSPKSAVEVLQTGREALILKDWLQTLTVKAVEAGLGDKPDSRASSVSRRSGPSKSENTAKRKRKSKKLDGFVVSTDEEEDDMDEITESETDSPRGSQGLLKSFIRAGDTAAKGSKDHSKMTNIVVISGPHGCGKTATVYAVAKELGFEVFEINSSSRRSGKDIIEKVGDMTRNHLVQHSNGQPPLDPVDEDKQRIDDALANDLQTGRQGTMNSFFKPKQATKVKPKEKGPLKTKTLSAGNDTVISKAPQRAQKQSLILIEEVDIIYKQDSLFWSTVFNLISTSKRPIILTCSDEAAVPMHELTLHAIIRLKPTPIDLAVDYMLLVAACEGHVLQREAVKALYESRGLDLRASLVELNFWCQFAVGDVKGGLDWFYSRWPHGSDVDKHGNTIRVVSEGTYQTGMGWLSQDFLESHLHHLAIEEEMLHEAWDGWNLDLGDWQKTIDIKDWTEKTQRSSSGKHDDRAALSIYSDFADAMSSADLCAGGTFAPDNQVRIHPILSNPSLTFQVVLDISLPELSAKVREDYTVAHDLLESSSLVSYDTLSKDVSLWMKSRARNYLQVDQHIQHGFEVQTELDRLSEADVVRLIRKHATVPENLLTRHDLSLAFDPISEPEKTYVWTTTSLEGSSFDRTMSVITEDLAPYVRSIVAYDARLQQDRAKLSNLMSEGGRKGKRMRTTRAAMSALEGGARSTTRRDKYFTHPALNPYLVLKTGLKSWQDALLALSPAKSSTSRRSSKGTLEEKTVGSDKDELVDSSS
jgi:DNA polymerase III delta prime subunit